MNNVTRWLMLAGTLIAGLSVPLHASANDATCEHPHPCGNEWPEGLTGPFEIPEATEVFVESHDGTPLHGWLWVPALPEGVRAPTILVSSPYYGFASLLEPPETRLIEQGYAVAAFSVRGTARSGGCFENKGLNEQQDQAHVVEWLAAQPWSSGRVAMMGLSYPGTTPLMAAIQSPPSLKAIIPMGPITDPFTEMHSPNGALYTMGGPNEAGRRGGVTFAPTDHILGAGGDPSTLPDRLCPELVEVLTTPNLGMVSDDRNPAYWSARNLTMGFPDITAAVLIGHGLKERAHPFQDDPMWEAISQAPKAMVLGQWAHEIPPVDWWTARVDRWLDYWLKGLGTPPEFVGQVSYEDSRGEWRDSAHWPPPESREEVLYLSSGALSPEAADEAASFTALPLPRTANVPGLDTQSADGWPLCNQATGTQLAYDSGVLDTDLMLAGNPKAWLRLSSSDVGGIVRVGLYAIPAGADCGAARLLSFGSVDLRFYEDTYTGGDFPVDRPVGLRVDLMNLAEAVAAGERLVVLVGAAELISHHEANNPLADERTSRAGQPYAPTITILGSAADSGSSHVVLALRSGSLGGAAPTVDYPPRPNVPLTGTESAAIPPAELASHPSRRRHDSAGGTSSLPMLLLLSTMYIRRRRRSSAAALRQSILKQTAI